MHTAAAGRSPLLAFIDAVAPKRFLRDPFGLLSGYRAYLVYTSLSAKSDRELTALGISRTDLPRIAVETIFESQRDH